ncbi:flagellar hook-length control protein FliK [Paenibacillus sp. GCM10012307]|nr:flagellar hook-length control protein FliK [Paenibacillus roseus]
MSAGQMMLIASTSSTPGSARPGALGGTNEVQAFPQMLVQFVQGGETQAGGTAANVSTLASLLPGELTLASKDGLENLLQLADEIRQQLDQLGDDTDPAQLEEMAEELQALLYTIMMTLPLPVQENQGQASNLPESLSEQASLAVAVEPSTEQASGLVSDLEPQVQLVQTQPLAAVQAAKTKVEELLQQIRTVAEQGLPKQVQDAFVPLMENKLDALKQLLAAGTGRQGAAEPSGEQQLDLRGGTILAPQHVSSQTMLARLGGSFHPLLKQASEQAIQNGNSLLSAEEADSRAAGANPAAVSDLLKPQMTAAPQVESMPKVPVERFAERMENFLFKQMQLTSLKGISEAKISLFPEHLGQVNIRLTLQNGQLTALFVTDSHNAKEMLENQMSQLRAALQAQGIQVERLEVTHTPQSGHSQYQNGREQGSGQQHNPGRQEQASEPASEDSFEQELRQLSEQFEQGINAMA